MQLSQKIKPIKEEKTYGELYIKSSDFPFLKDAKLNDEVELTITVKVKSLRAPDRWEISEEKANPKDVNANVCITKLHKVEKPKK